MLALQILIDGFAISALYALGATGFTLIFGVSGVLNLSHGAIMVLAAVAAWAAGSILQLDHYSGALVGVGVALIASLATYFAVVLPIQRSRRIPNEEKEIFVLTGTLLWGIMIQEAIAYFFTNNAKTVLPIIEGVVTVLGVRTPKNEWFTAGVCCVVIGLLWLLVNRTKTGKAVLAASMNPRGVTLSGMNSTTSTSWYGRSTACWPASPACCSACSSAYRPTASDRSPRARSRSWCWAASAACRDR